MRPSYSSLLNALMYATSMRQLSQASREHRINLYLRPPGVSGWMAPLTPDRVDALVRRAHHYSCGAIATWQRSANTVSGGNAAAAAAGGSRKMTHVTPNTPDRSGSAMPGDVSTVAAAAARDISAKMAVAVGGGGGTTQPATNSFATAGMTTPRCSVR